MLKIIKTNLFLIISILLAFLIIGGALFFSKKVASGPTRVPIVEEEREEYAENVFLENNKQIIEIKAKNGFSPIHSIAKANIPTILRVDTNGTFDCSSVVRIPSLKIDQNLPLSGTTEIDLGANGIGKLQGTCGMGMYPFDIKFE